MRVAMRAALPTRRVVHLALLAAAAMASPVGCGDEGMKVAPTASASALPTGPVLDGKLGEAAKDIAKGAEKPASSAAGAEGPPPNGMFPPGAADRAHATGAPPKVEVMGEGSEPRLQLGASRPEGKQEAVLVVAVSSGKQQALPPLALRLSIGPKGAKDKKGPKDGAKAEPKPEAPAADAPPAETVIVAEITEAAVAGMPGGQVPKDLIEAIAKMKGSTVTWPLGPTGPGRLDHALAAGAEAGLDIALEAVEEAMGALLVPTPDKPVGEGATWMVTDRTTSMGVDGVRYRFVKVDTVDGDRATLSVTIRKYAADDRLDLPLGPQMTAASLDGLDFQGKSTLHVIPKSWVPEEGEVSSRLVASIAPPGAKNPGAQPQQQRAQVQLEVAAQLRSPAALAAAARKNGAPPADGAAPPPRAPPLPPRAPAPPRPAP